MIVWIASFPRSGNTFFRVVTEHVYGVPTYSLYDADLPEPSEGGFARAPLPKPLDQLKADAAIHLVKTHDLPADASPAIYLVRDGRDALISYAHLHLRLESKAKQRSQLRESWKELRKKLTHKETRFEATLRSLITSDPFGGWGNNVLAWSGRPAASRTAVLRFEDLIARPIEETQRVVREAGVDLPPVGDKIPTFEELHAAHPHLFRKGKVGSWRDEMSDELHELFWQHHGDAMRKMGYTR